MGLALAEIVAIAIGGWVVLVVALAAIRWRLRFPRAQCLSACNNWLHDCTLDLSGLAEAVEGL